MKRISVEQSVETKLDRIVQLLEDIFILLASNASMNRKVLREILSVDMKRVNRISKHLTHHASEK